MNEINKSKNNIIKNVFIFYFFTKKIKKIKPKNKIIKLWVMV